MALFEIKPIETNFVEVDYIGGTVQVPENHEWVSMVQQVSPSGESKSLLMSYEVEPTVSRKGHYLTVPGTESRVLCEVTAQDHRGSLRRVQGHSQEEMILANAEELAYKFAQVLASDDEDKIHTLFCPEHGVFVDFLNHTADALAEHFEQVQAVNEAEEDDSPISIKMFNENGEVVDLADNLPPELASILGQITSALKG